MWSERSALLTVSAMLHAMFSACTGIHIANAQGIIQEDLGSSIMHEVYRDQSSFRSAKEQ